jgi:exodeoxyribonuclease VII small subunit
VHCHTDVDAVVVVFCVITWYVVEPLYCLTWFHIVMSVSHRTVPAPCLQLARLASYKVLLAYNSAMARELASTKKKAAAAQVPPASYEAAVAELDEWVERMETGEMSLEQTLVAYERGAYLLNYCRERLAAVEQQVKVLEDGELKPLLTSQTEE